MDFAWTQEQEEIYQRISALVQEHLPGEQTDHVWWTKDQWQWCGKIGLLGLCIPVRYGGSGMDALTTTRAVEAFGLSCQDMGLVFSSAAHLFACSMPIAEYGEEAIMQAWLPGLCSGAFVGANAITEKEAGSDVFALKTRAVRVSDKYYVLNGEKSFVSNGPLADLFLVYAVTNPEHGYLGISAFLVERSTEGLSLSEPINKLGLTSTPACRISFHDCHIPINKRLGREGQGQFIFKRSMQWERSCLFASYLGQMQRQLQRTVTHVQERRQFGAPLSKKQAVAHCVADMYLRLEAARWLLYRACWLLDQGKDAQLAVAAAKVAISEAAVQNGFDALRLHGASGIIEEVGIERMVRDALPSVLFSGATDVQRDIIASELGL
jgi:alkylation response protein AidB-like acyl-CoA dehydrogenase